MSAIIISIVADILFACKYGSARLGSTKSEPEMERVLIWVIRLRKV